jgi:hypothetical protein
VTAASRPAIRAERRSRAVRRRRWLSAAGLLLLGTFGVRDCYVAEYRHFTDVEQAYPFGTASVHLSGSWTSAGRGDREIHGSPYWLFVDLETMDSTVTAMELVSLTLRGREDGRTFPFAAPGKAYLRPRHEERVTGPIDGKVYPMSAEKIRADPELQELHTYFFFRDVALPYQQYSVSGVLRVHTTGGIREVPLRGELRKSFRTERRSKLGDVIESV